MEIDARVHKGKLILKLLNNQYVTGSIEELCESLLQLNSVMKIEMIKSSTYLKGARQLQNETFRCPICG